MHKVARGYIVSPPKPPPQLCPAGRCKLAFSWPHPSICIIYPAPAVAECHAFPGWEGLGGTSHNQPLVLKVLLSFSTSAGLSGARGARQGPP